MNSVLQYTSLLAGDTPLDPRRCRLADLCAYSTHAVQDKARHKSQSLDLDIVPADIEITSDEAAIKKILTALLENAIKFTPEHGAIGINVSGVVGEAAVHLVVWDTGIGMTADQVAHLFEPFVQGDQTLARRFEGLGLGLAYVHKLVELLGGTVTVSSEIGQGSRFAVTLPT